MSSRPPTITPLSTENLSYFQCLAISLRRHDFPSSLPPSGDHTALSHVPPLRRPAKAASGALRARRWPPKGDVAVRPERPLSPRCQPSPAFQSVHGRKKANFPLSNWTATAL